MIRTKILCVLLRFLWPVMLSTTFAAAPPYQRMDFGPALFWTFQIAPGNRLWKWNR
jgi:hypothetical protein